MTYNGSAAAKLFIHASLISRLYDHLPNGKPHQLMLLAAQFIGSIISAGLPPSWRATKEILVYTYPRWSVPVWINDWHAICEPHF